MWGSHIINILPKPVEDLASSLWPLSLLTGWGYYHISNAMQYSYMALEKNSLVMYDSKSFSYRIPLFLMPLRISETFVVHK